jgi:peptidoglycan/xylan/chitin deacetylase (PgdA/CDA1 family)
MLRTKVLRFIGIAFVVGAFLGLVSGLAFGGGSSDSGTPKAASPAIGRTSPGGGSAPGNTSSTFIGPVTAAKASAIGANELGQVPVLRYQQISDERGDENRSPQDFAKDLDLLKSEGFVAVNLRDLASGNIDIPAGMSPVVLTFDGSSLGQYNILDDGTLDPASAIGMLQGAVDSGGWAPKATFYVLQNVTSKDNELFGQADRQQEKLRNLVDWGYEVGSHTISNLNLKKASALDAQMELEESQRKLQEIIGTGYLVTSLAVPSGEYPADERILSAGTYDGKAYKYSSAVALGDTLSASPFSTLFNPMHIPRLTVTGSNLRDAIANLKAHPELRYISDGDPTTVSAPATLAVGLGAVRSDLGRPLVQY